MAAATALSAGAMGLAQALDLGEPEGTPRLGQPLRLDFPLSLATGESTDGLQVSVRARPALAAETDNAWLQSPFRIILTNTDGRPGLRICNEQPLHEPMLELHLALRSATGVVTRRRYDVLIDPPLAGAARAACEPLAAALAAPRARATQPPVQRPRQPAMRARGSGTDAIVLPGDTLGELAQQLRGNRQIPLPVMMAALYRANPDAFIDSPDRLLAGSYLSIPDLDALAQGGNPAPSAAGTGLPAGDPGTVVTSPTMGSSPDAVPNGWAGRLSLSYTLSAVPTAAEQRRVAERYLAAAAPAVATVAKAPRPPAAVAATPSAPPAKTFTLPWLTLAFALLGVVLYLLLRKALKQRRRPPAAAVEEPAPEAAPPVMPVVPPMARPLPRLAPEAAEEEVGRDFYEEVATLLSEELRKNPERRDLRFRLLELYYTSGKREAFVEHTHDYLKSLRGTPDENWAEIARMGRQIAPETGLYPAQAGEVTRTNVIPLQSARAAARRFYENVDAAALRDLREHLDRSYGELRRDGTFWRELATLTRDWVSPEPGLVPAERLTQYLGGARILFRDERQRAVDEGAALIAIGQVLMARRLGYRQVVAGGMRSRHALMVAHAAQQLGLDCALHLSSTEQTLNAGALERVAGAHLTLQTVSESALGTAGNTQLQALRDALSRHESLYISPAAAGPPPYPTIVVDLAALHGRNLRAQMGKSIGRLADVLITHNADGLHTIGLMEAFLDSAGTQLLCMESTSPAPGSLLFPREHRLLRTTGRVGYQRIAEDTARFITQFCAERQYAQLGQAGSEVFAATLRMARDLPAGQAVVAVLPSEGTHDALQTSEESLRAGGMQQGMPPSRA